MLRSCSGWLKGISNSTFLFTSVYKKLFPALGISVSPGDAPCACVKHHLPCTIKVPCISHKTFGCFYFQGKNAHNTKLSALNTMVCVMFIPSLTPVTPYLSLCCHFPWPCPFAELGACCLQSFTATPGGVLLGKTGGREDRRQGDGTVEQ